MMMQVGSKKNFVLVFTYLFFFLISGIAVCSSTMHKVVLVLSLALKICAGTVQNISCLLLALFRLMISLFNYEISIIPFYNASQEILIKFDAVIFTMYFYLKWKYYSMKTKLNADLIILVMFNISADVLIWHLIFFSFQTILSITVMIHIFKVKKCHFALISVSFLSTSKNGKI